MLSLDVMVEDVSGWSSIVTSITRELNSSVNTIDVSFQRLNVRSLEFTLITLEFSLLMLGPNVVVEQCCSVALVPW